uniref:Uncharacterized protein n=1 Tax=Cannabis sativa TaxID=3483 RepID=A0A803Q3N1_CANSA
MDPFSSLCIGPNVVGPVLLHLYRRDFPILSDSSFSQDTKKKKRLKMSEDVNAAHTLLRATNPLLTRMRESVPILARVTQTNQWLGSITTTKRTFITLSSREFHGRVQSGLDFRAGGRRKIFTSTPVRAAHVNDAGSIDSPLINSMQIKVLVSCHLINFNSSSLNPNLGVWESNSNF